MITFNKRSKIWENWNIYIYTSDADLLICYTACLRAASSVHYTTRCKLSLGLLRMGEIVARNMLSWLKLLIKLVFLHLVGCLHYFILDPIFWLCSKRFKSPWILGRLAHRMREVFSQPVRETATYRCDDTRGCVMQFWPPDDERMCSKHVEATK